MNLKYIVNLVAAIGGILFLASTAGAYSVSLDVVENAGWWENDLSQSYLIIAGEHSRSNYAKDNVIWTDFTAMVTDLSDGWIGAVNGGTWVGGYTLYSGGNVFDKTQRAIWKQITLPAGDYTISLDSESAAYNLQGYDLDGVYEGGDMWNVYVQMWTSDGQNLPFADGTLTFGSGQDALDYYTDYSVSLSLAEAADLFLYINDFNSLDNTGSVAFNILPVPVPSTILLFGTGLATLAGGRKLRKKKERLPNALS